MKFFAYLKSNSIAYVSLHSLYLNSLDFGNFANLVHLELALCSSIYPRNSIALSSHSKLQHLTLDHTMLNDDLFLSRNFFYSVKSFTVNSEKLKLFEKLKRNNGFPSLKFLQVSNVYEDAELLKSTVRYLTRNANHLQKIQFGTRESTSQYDRAESDITLQAWLESVTT